MLIASEDDVIGVQDIPPEIDADAREQEADPAAPPGTFRAQKAEAERQILLSALERHGWHITHTAEALGLADHASLLKIMRRHGLSRPAREA
jgi:transcriptional regulator of acetoin/glycerol metabolism